MAIWANGMVPRFRLTKKGIMVWICPIMRALSCYMGSNKNKLLLILATHGRILQSSNFANLADCIIVVHEPCPYKLTSKKAYIHVNELVHWQQQGKTIHLVGNKNVHFDARKQWLGMFPWRTKCFVPVYAYKDVQACAWRGQLIQDDPAVLASLLEALGESVRRYCMLQSEDLSLSLQGGREQGNAIGRVSRSNWFNWRKKAK